MLRLRGGQVESLWDEVLPEMLRALPDELAQIDALLRDEGLFAPIEAHWQREAEERGRLARGHGRPTIPMQTYVRLMVLKHRYGWGYETLMREVSDSLHLSAGGCGRSRAACGAGRGRPRARCWR